MKSDLCAPMNAPANFLMSSGAQGFVIAFFGKSRIFSLLGDQIGRALLQVGEQVLAHGLVDGQDDGAGQGHEGPVPEVDPGVGLGVVGGLLDELQEELVDETVLLHGLFQHALNEKDMVFLLPVGIYLIWKKKIIL